jgi:hypothetical protein
VRVSPSDQHAGAPRRQTKCGRLADPSRIHAAATAERGPLVARSGIAIMFDVIDRGSALQGLATIPEFIWELSFGIYFIVKGFKPAP